ncbi:MAG: RnfABCDGE type electron transport complex subunit D, partial [Oscillospiraceae bacterium]
TFVNGGIDAFSGATPLELISKGNTELLPSVLELFIGLKGGCIGEVSALALLIGGVYLVAKRIISPLIPLTYFTTVVVFSLVVGINPVYQLLTGGLMLGAVFMATDYSTTPITNKGKFIFAIGCGVITMVIRIYGSYPEGVSFAILLMNIIAPLIDQYTQTKPFGTGGKVK